MTKKHLLSNYLEIVKDSFWTAYTIQDGTVWMPLELFDPEITEYELCENEKWKLKRTWAYCWNNNKYMGGFNSRQKAFQAAYGQLFDDADEMSELSMEQWIKYGKINNLDTQFIKQ
jgi:hypothetical protein